jgi:hypothetical protein
MRDRLRDRHESRVYDEAVRIVRTECSAPFGYVERPDRCEVPASGSATLMEPFRSTVVDLEDERERARIEDFEPCLLEPRGRAPR